ncbi:hypothetical protein HGA34_03260 [Candidatus Falkowbacteria bacterium]|nr:hypothetical protein [Candidatus Falkowbacteria bacterium]
MEWINILHLYQPANLESAKVVEATQRSYERIIRALEEHPEEKITLNIAGCLVKRWDEEFHYNDLIFRIKSLVARGQVELTGSAAYHALLPLVSIEEAEAQIIEQAALLQKYFGTTALRGFFLPELSYSAEVAKLIKRLGYEWLVLDEISLSAGSVDWSKQYVDQASGLKILFRSRNFSESYVPSSLLRLANEPKRPQVIVSASDAELYGLRHLDPLEEFEQALKLPSIKTLTASEFMDSRKNEEAVDLLPSSWQSTKRDISNGNPYKLWNDRKSKIHKELWQLANLAQELNRKFAQDKNAWWSRWHLVRGLASCVWWWASSHDFRKVYGPVAWNPDEVEKGVNELIRSIRALESSTDMETKVSAEKLAEKIRRDIWTRHWKKKIAN